MTNDLSAQSYFEVYSILNNLGEAYISKIPQKLYQEICEKKSNRGNIENGNIGKDAVTFVAILHYRYWTKSQKEKLELINIFKENEKIKNEIIEDENLNELFVKRCKKEICENNENVAYENSEPVALMEVKKESFFVKIINFIKGIFSRNK